MFNTVTKQLKRAMSAVNSVLAVADTAAATLDPQLKAFLQEGEQLDGLKPIQLTLARWIENDNQSLEDHEAAQRSALRELKRLREQRDEHQAKLYSKLVRIKQIFEDAFGPGKASIYLGLEPRLRDAEPQAFRRQARETIAILEDPELTTPEPIVAGVWDRPASYAKQIQDSLTPFHNALDEIESQKRAVEKAQKAKTDLLTAIGNRLTWSIRLIEAIYRLADLGFHADRLRVTIASRPSPGEPVEDQVGEGEIPSEGEEVNPGEVPESGASESEPTSAP